MRRYRLTPQAENDLGEILDYIAADDPVAANRLIDSIESKCQAHGVPDFSRFPDNVDTNYD
jgi:plasmid stabilization system protein ParE